MTNAVTGGQKGSKDERFDLLPTGPLAAVARHYGVGARKYEDRNWEKGYDWSLSYAALQRHANAFWGGEDIDEETGSPHMAAVVFHALALLEFASTHPELDNRVKIEVMADEEILTSWAGEEIRQIMDNVGLGEAEFETPIEPGTHAALVESLQAFAGGDSVTVLSGESARLLNSFLQEVQPFIMQGEENETTVSSERPTTNETTGGNK